MKVILFFLLFVWSVSMMCCRAGKGCPSNGKNIGAERILSGDAKSIKAASKARKFKS